MDWIEPRRFKAISGRSSREMGHGLYLAQMGDRHNHAKTISGLGNAKLIELRENDRSGTYQVIYTLEMDKFIFVYMPFRKNRKAE